MMHTEGCPGAEDEPTPASETGYLTFIIHQMQSIYQYEDAVNSDSLHY